MSDDKISKNRRGFLVSSLSLAATGALASVMPKDKMESSLTNTLLSCDERTESILNSAKKWGDELAYPIPYTPALGVGKEHGMALGGGGLYLLSFYCGYFHGMKKNGIDLSAADVVVGTSAGSIAASMLTTGEMWRMFARLDIVGKLPKLFSALLPAITNNPSQVRVKSMLLQYKNADMRTIQAIGHAAMASSNGANSPENYVKSVAKIVKDSP